MRFAPRVHERLVAKIWAVDDGRLAIAEIWRIAGREADQLGIPRPGYHVVRGIVRAERERRVARDEALAIAAEAAARRVPAGFRAVDHAAAAAKLTRWPQVRTRRVR